MKQYLLYIIGLGLPAFSMADTNINLHVMSATCQRTTERNFGNDTDELYVLVAGATPSGKTDKRLPSREDYYQARSNTKLLWINQHGEKEENPVIWAGTMKPQQSATFVVHIGEQDNATIGDVMKWAAEAASKIAPGIGAVAKEIVGKIPFPEGDENIGRIVVKLTTRADGRIDAEFNEALNATRTATLGPHGATFSFGGDSTSKYSFSFVATSWPAP